MYEEPEEPIPEEEIPEEPPSIEEFEEVVPPRGTAAFRPWKFKIYCGPDLSQNKSKYNIPQYTFLLSYQ